MRALITGTAGFAGSHLVEYLLSRDDVEVSGIVRTNNMPNIDHLRSRLRLFYGDVADFEFVKSVIGDLRPDLIFHLAGQADVALSWKHPALTINSNVIGQLNILESVAQYAVDARVLVIGSGDEYGLILPSELPIKETNQLRPYSPYAVSKIAQDMLGYQYFVSHKLLVVRVRPFNHIGPRQSDAFVTSSFARQIAEIELGLREPIVKVGNLDARRDFTDVRDMVRAYWLALLRGEPGEVYNLASGQTWCIVDILHSLLAKSHAPIRVEQDPYRLRPSDVPVIVGDYSKFAARTGWNPHIPLEETLSEILDYWRDVLSQRQSS
ncbi:MAG: GDP-mannose 4,6-dehydratase [Chloroflexi bacterium]|nr:GDP-mannose 4,6-dehydratase [Chloroflexota bacterium]